MNKKQSIVGWAMIVSIGVVIARTIIAIPYNGFLSVVAFYYLVTFIFVSGGLFIFVLRDRKK